MIKLFRNHTTIFILFLLSFIAIFPYLKPDFIIGIGESGFLIDPRYMDLLYEWNEKINYGFQSGFQSNILFYKIIWPLLSAFIGYIHPSIIWAFLVFFIPGVALYFALDTFFSLKHKIIYLPACILYTFNIFRLSVSYTNTGQNVLFMLTPVFFAIYYKFTKEQKFIYVPVMTVLFVLTAAMASNLAVFTIPYMLAFFYFIFLVLTRQSITKRFILYNLIMLALSITVNLYWILPLITLLRTSNSDAGGSLWNVVNAGTFFDHLRFMGFWAFKSGYGTEAYFPYFKTYYSPLLLISTYIIPFLALGHLLDRRVIAGTTQKTFKLFISLLIVVSLFLVAGAKGPFWFIYRLMYEKISVLQIYREPYAKFMPLYIIAISISLVLSLIVLNSRIHKLWVKVLLFLLVNIVIIFNAFPIFTGNVFYIKRWNQGPAGTIVVIPEYWQKAKAFFEGLDEETRTLIVPYNEYVSLNNWPYGVNVVGNIADYIVSAKFVKGWNPDNSRVGKIFESIYFSNGFESDVKKLLGFLNIRYVLQENDLEWRYHNRMLSPSKTADFLEKSGLTPVETFGLFDETYLKSLANTEPNGPLRSQFYIDLLDRPALVVYEVPKEYYLPHFYVPTQTIYTVGAASDLLSALSVSDAPLLSQYFIVQPGTVDKTKSIANDYIRRDSSEVIIIGRKRASFPYSFYLSEWDNSTPWPQASYNPSGPIYPFVKVKELLELNGEKEVRKRVSKYSWFGAKRIEEIKSFKVRGSRREALVDDFIKLNNDLIALSKVFFKKSSDSIVSDAWYNTLLASYLYFEKGLSVLEDTNLSDTTLSKVSLVRDNYTDLFEYLAGNYAKSAYIYDFDVAEPGTYDLMVNIAGSKWEKIDSIPIENDLSVNMQSIIDDKIKPILKVDNFTHSDISQLITIKDWKPGKKYKITFEYKIRSDELLVYGLEDLFDYSLGSTLHSINWDLIKSRNFPIVRKQQFKDKLRTSRICVDKSDDCYTKYERVVKASDNSHGGYLYLQTPLESPDGSSTEVRHLKITEYTEPVFALKKQTNQEARIVPSISFSKINPTRYEIDIKGATDPFTLVFNEKFNENWKLYLKDTTKIDNENPLVMSLRSFLSIFESTTSAATTPISYFDGAIINAGSSSIFEPKLALGDKTISALTTTHFRSNGFANAWLIQPKDLDGKTDYTLVVKFSLQRKFYALFLLSAAIFLICTMYLFGYLCFVFVGKFRKAYVHN